MPRTVSLSLLDSLKVASPCDMAWDSMRPVDGDRIRHCPACDLDVFNLSAMPREEAEAVVTSRLGSGRFCARMYQRADGTLIAQDCPVGLRRARQRLVRGISRVAAAIVFMLGGFALARSREKTVTMPGLSRIQPFATVCKWVRPPAPTPPVPATVTVSGSFVMGDVALPVRQCR